jgi:hypothetical protein
MLVTFLRRATIRLTFAVAFAPGLAVASDARAREIPRGPYDVHGMRTATLEPPAAEEPDAPDEPDPASEPAPAPDEPEPDEPDEPEPEPDEPEPDEPEPDEPEPEPNVDRELLRGEPPSDPEPAPDEPNVPEQVEAEADEGVPFAIMSPRRRFRSEAHRRRYMKRHATRPGATPLFARDPVTDGTIMGVSLGFAFLLEAVIFTGELTPQSPRDTDRLLPIDRPIAQTNRPVPGANIASDVMLGLAGVYAITDSALTGRREGRTHGWTDFLMYTEAVALNFALADLAKLAVRRARPIAYYEARELGAVEDRTGRNMSFYSLHAAGTASLSATATYLAFLRNRNPWQKWVTLGVGIGLTTGVSTMRVLSLNHFPTDVIAGSLIGTAIGVLVPHLHRIDRGRRLRVVPMDDAQTRARGMSVSGLF